MYFPADMTFQYFFFDTYIGYFLQILPISLISGGIYALLKKRRSPENGAVHLCLSSLFVCYLAALISLTLFMDVIGAVYYFLFYHRPSGTTLFQIVLEYDFIPDFFFRFSGENIGNILLFLPFGFLYPLSKSTCSWKRTMLVGLAVSVGIELLQPLFGRSFDINDIILNGIGVLLSAAVFHAVKQAVRKKK
jgi:glycopeptide antibiotics resistance protein